MSGNIILYCYIDAQRRASTVVIYFSILFAKQWICSFQNQWRVLVVRSFCLLCCPNISLSHCLNVSLPLFQCPSVIWSHCLTCPTASLGVALLSIVQYFQWVSFDSKRKGVKVRLCPPPLPSPSSLPLVPPLPGLRIVASLPLLLSLSLSPFCSIYLSPLSVDSPSSASGYGASPLPESAWSCCQQTDRHSR